MVMLDLFAGIGGFSLAGHQLGWETAAFVEWEKYPQKVLKKNFPGVPVFGDIRNFNRQSIDEEIDIITGGFPCQPFSTAGKRAGESDDRYLWPEMLRVIREFQPAWVVGENVAGILSMEDGKIIERVQVDLEREGYEVQTFVIPASAVGAIHRRDRVWIVAYNEKFRRSNRSIKKTRGYKGPQIEDRGFCSNATNANQKGLQRGEKPGSLEKVRTKRNEHPARCIQPGRLQRPTKPPIRRRNDGVSHKLDKNRLMALGNAIVPQVAYQIFKAIELYNLNK